jgi:hypothetical protein
MCDAAQGRMVGGTASRIGTIDRVRRFLKSHIPKGGAA